MSAITASGEKRGFRLRIANHMLIMHYGTVATPWGTVGITVSAHGVCRVAFDVAGDALLTGVWAEAFAGYLAGRPFFDQLPIDLTGIPAFTQRVLHACRTIPYGTVMTYRELAGALGMPRAARAVGQALARNPVPIVIPCHRVVGAGGRLTGFLGGLDWKCHLLQHEGVVLN